MHESDEVSASGVCCRGQRHGELRPCVSSTARMQRPG